MNDQQITSILRKVITYIAGFAVGWGYFDAAHLGAVVDAIVQLIGSAVFVYSTVAGAKAHSDKATVINAANAIVAQPTVLASWPVISALRVAGASVNTEGMGNKSNVANL